MMKLAEFDYYLAPELIAQEPAPCREQSKLMAVDRHRRQWRHEESFAAIRSYLQAGDVLVVNDTRVVNARLSGNKPSGGKVEALMIKCQGDQALAMIQTARRPRPGDEYFFGQYRATVRNRDQQGWLLDFMELRQPPLWLKLDYRRCRLISKEKRQRRKFRIRIVYAIKPSTPDSRAQ